MRGIVGDGPAECNTLSSRASPRRRAGSRTTSSSIVRLPCHSLIRGVNATQHLPVAAHQLVQPVAHAPGDRPHGGAVLLDPEAQVPSRPCPFVAGRRRSPARRPGTAAWVVRPVGLQLVQVAEQAGGQGAQRNLGVEPQARGRRNARREVLRGVLLESLAEGVDVCGPRSWPRPPSRGRRGRPAGRRTPSEPRAARSQGSTGRNR